MSSIKAEKDSSKNKKVWTISAVINWTIQYFRNHNIPEARLNAEILLSYVLGLERLKLYLQFDRILKKEELDKYKNLIKKRLERIPVAYLIGRKEFMGLDFYVDKHVLVPRPETELLVENAIDKIKHQFPSASHEEKMEKQFKNVGEEALKKRIPHIVDLGVGCGNIAVSLAKYIEDCKIYAIDINRKCLEIAFLNGQRKKVEEKITFLLGNLFYPLEGYGLKNQVDFIISNPPYVKSTEFNNLSLEVMQEPRFALDGGKDGLNFYRQIIPQSVIYLKEGGYLMLEIGDGQKGEVIDLMEKIGFFSIQVIKDYSGIERVILAQKGSSEKIHANTQGR